MNYPKILQFLVEISQLFDQHLINYLLYIQFHVAYSSIVTGVGIMAGIPAMCSLQNQCFFNAAATSVDQMVSDTK